ncbi:hypothetical protein QEZ52_15975 [Aliisedimentitalea scapharcae]|uniref:Sulfotransferase family protein n=1 Tax=Aliisedimentitalea scapharcae TaxID=1524259 RepID=A0ABZ2XPS5_9RHOB|nr:hypothetical protein K3727_15900 [Rhodobacteraceae bacterium M382]
MNVFLHIGAHRCATTTFQDYLRQNATQLGVQGTGFWGPRRTRSGLFNGIVPAPGVNTGRDKQRRAQGRVQLNLTRCAGLGVQQLIVSDENMLGSVRANLRMGDLYCGVGERMARFGAAFGGRVTDVVLSIRSLEYYWASALGYSVTRGRRLPTPAELKRLVASRRSWRDVITDVACAIPEARIRVLPFETYAGRPDAQLQAMTHLPAPRTHARLWHNATPRLPELRSLVAPEQMAALPAGDGRWQPFTPGQQLALRETYADDLMWLTAGADGLARLARDPDNKMVGQNLPWTDLTRGRPYDDEDRRLAGTG